MVERESESGDANIDLVAIIGGLVSHHSPVQWWVGQGDYHCLTEKQKPGKISFNSSDNGLDQEFLQG